jgi:hypothetical protein
MTRFAESLEVLASQVDTRRRVQGPYEPRAAAASGELDYRNQGKSSAGDAAAAGGVAPVSAKHQCWYSNRNCDQIITSKRESDITDAVRPVRGPASAL